MTKLVFVELRRLTSQRKNNNEMEFLSSRYATLKNAGVLPNDIKENEYSHLATLPHMNMLHVDLQQ